MKNRPIKCTRCRHKHTEADLIERRSTSVAGLIDMVCPRCGCKSYYDCTPQVAWCWATGLIEIGDDLPTDASDGSGVIEIARGPRYALVERIDVLARHGYHGERFVPGVPEAQTQQDKIDALATWLTWCAKRKVPVGVMWGQMLEGHAVWAAVDNPFKAQRYGDRQLYHTDVASRVGAVKKFDADECHAALRVPGLQKTVEQAVHARLRRLEKEATP